MTELPLPAGGGRLAENVMHFARVLRAAGIPVGPDKVLDAVAALQVAGVQRRDDVYWTLNAVFLDRHDQQHLFDQAFHVFWRDPRLLDQVMQLMLPSVQGGTASGEDAVSQRLAEALAAEQPSASERQPPEDEEVEVRGTLTYSAEERLQTMDFASMSAAELARAREAIARLHLPVRPVTTRRYTASSRGRRLDPRASMRASMRSGGAVIALRRSEAVRRHPPLVVLCDISGSMSQYSRMLLHFLHTLTNDRDRVHTFLFGTRLTNVTRYLRGNDVDRALEKTGAAVADWAGGTRIGECLRAFNRDWSRRVLGQGATVLLVTDGLDREAGSGVAAEMDRLQRSARRLIWLNPLLRYHGFEARPAGIRAMLPYVDEFRPVHNLRSLRELADALSDGPPARGRAASA
ncbi:VWA domain-containing protein [Aquisalimonas lutea]|uniref:vWA domain-containing protein n=1 Tax=Aquisalimonas lutea TaxID=1327750 RepID=UPI0025B57CF4|nr:VWA domain-containing protein [Aquisalimonas lutea]MDN3519324.1 VWA domain-containing protein [Aquisalimonas lutea]